MNAPLQKSPIPSATNSRRRWILRVFAYLRDPKVLIGGVLVFAVTQGVDLARDHWKHSRAEVLAAQKDVSELVRTLPESSNGIGATMRAVEALFVVYREASTQEYLKTVAGDLSRLRAATTDLENKAAAAKRAREEEQRVAEESQKANQAAKEASEAARVKLEAEAKARAEAEAVAKLEAERREAERKAAEQRATSERRDLLYELRERRMPR